MVVTPAGTNSYEVTVASSTGNVFSIERQADSTVDLTCTTAGTAGCPGNGRWD
jgi:hypothetical protein